MSYEKILVIDKEATQLKLLESYLEKKAFQVSGFCSACTALENLMDHPSEYGVILLDHATVKKEILPFLTTLKQFPALKTIPVLLMSQEESKRELIEAFKYGIFDFIRKPLDKDLLILMIKRALRDHQALMPC